MRSRIVDFLNHAMGTDLFNWLVPEPATVYAVTMLVCLIIFVKRCRFVKLSRFDALSAAIWAMIGGLIGARIFFLLMHIDQLIYKPSIMYSISGGTASWGAYIGGGLAFVGYFRYNHKSSLPYLDVLGTVMGLAPAIGRWSCFLNGDDFGTLSNVPWAAAYPHGSIPFTYQVRQGLIDPLADFSLPVHPNQIYLSLNGLALFFLFTFIWKKYRLAPGVLFFLYWVLYSFNRFFLEFFRDGVKTDYLGYFSPSQIMTMIVFTLAVGSILWLRRLEKLNAGIDNPSIVSGKS